METYIELDCSAHSQSIIDVLIAFQDIGWKIYNSHNKVEYLPYADDENFNWISEELLEEEFYNIVIMKCKNSEIIGVNLFHNIDDVGISMLARDTKNITLGMSINRKKIFGQHTDMVWYLENVIYKLFEAGTRIVSYRFCEMED